MTPKQAAEWMNSRLAEKKFLDQAEVADELRKRNPDLTYDNDSGNPAIKANVLKEFRKTAGHEVVWSRSEKHWRYRAKGDGPGRMQY